MTNYLVTGSSGFVGRHLCAHLQAPYNRISTLSRIGRHSPEADKHWQADLLARSLPPDLLNDIDVVIHLAGLAHQSATRQNDSQPYFDLNRNATLKLAKAASAAGVKKFLFVSSVKAASYDALNEPNDERFSVEPSDAYGLSKLQAEQALLSLQPTGMDITIVRPSLVYGAGVKGNLHTMLRGVRRGWFPTISGGGIRSMVSVQDLCAAIISLCHASGVAHETFIVTDGERYTVERICTAIRVALAKRGRGLHIRDRDLLRIAALNNAVKRRVGAGLPINTVIDKLCSNELYTSARLQRAIDWCPTYTLEHQLPAMLQDLDASND